METEPAILKLISLLVLQLAVILIAAKIAGEICERYLRQPSVLGELVAGMIIGPYALGGLSLPFAGPLFSPNPGAEGPNSFIPVSLPLYAVAQIAAVILLFVAGLETDLVQFIRYGGPATVVATGGILFPFFFGAGATVYFGFANSFMEPEALFMGAIMTATSVGITARVLSDLRRLDTPEGVTILAAAVIDDVMGILVLTIVVSLTTTGQVSLGQLGWIAFKAIGFWVALTGIGILLSKHISRFLSWFRVEGANVALALSLAFLCAALAESFGLAMIIGAYSIGLALSNSDAAHTLERPLRAIYNAFVPIFFVVMGMLVNFEAMRGVLVFGIVISFLAIIGKVFGCGLPALMVGFNRDGALRVGVGMLPRGEVALIVAGVGLASGVIQQDIFGVSIMMTVITTLLAPILLVPAFLRGGGGRRKMVEGVPGSR